MVHVLIKDVVPKTPHSIINDTVSCTFVFGVECPNLIIAPLQPNYQP